MSNKCECSLRTSLVGDGCDVCNPSLVLEYAYETIAELKVEIEELQRQNAMLVDSLRDCAVACDPSICSGAELAAYHKAKRALSANATQSAAWLEASHIEWMR